MVTARIYTECVQRSVIGSQLAVTTEQSVRGYRERWVQFQAKGGFWKSWKTPLKVSPDISYSCNLATVTVPESPSSEGCIMSGWDFCSLLLCGHPSTIRSLFSSPHNDRQAASLSLRISQIPLVMSILYEFSAAHIHASRTSPTHLWSSVSQHISLLGLVQELGSESTTTTLTLYVGLFSPQILHRKATDYRHSVTTVLIYTQAHGRNPRSSFGFLPWIFWKIQCSFAYGK